MANKKSKVRYRSRPKKSVHRSRKQEIHAVPAILETVGLLYPGIVSPNAENGGWGAIMSTNNPTITDKLGAVKGGIEGYANIGNDIDGAILIAAGMVGKWIGKKTGLNKVGTKRIKLF